MSFEQCKVSVLWHCMLKNGHLSLFRPAIKCVDFPLVFSFAGLRHVGLSLLRQSKNRQSVAELPSYALSALDRVLRQCKAFCRQHVLDAFLCCLVFCICCDSFFFLSFGGIFAIAVGMFSWLRTPVWKVTRSINSVVHRFFCFFYIY